MRCKLALGLLVALSACGGKPPGNVDTERLNAAPSEPGQWLSLGRNWQADRFSPLTRISAETAAELGFAWEYEFRSRRGRVEHGQEATPLVIDGVIYASGPWGSAIAVDARTGKERWRYDPDVDGSYNRKACCDVVSRGLQVWQGKVYVATLDGHLVALDASNGKELWKADTLIERELRSYTITGPPQVAGSVVVVGNSGAEFGVRGYVTAYDLDSGQQRWRFYSVPGDPDQGPPEHPEMAMALETWDPESDWESGLGGTVWGEMNYDPELDLLYVGTGNASPEAPWVRSPSGGDNLFLASILAIKPGTGKLAWHYQTTPGEMWDYTATQNMILADLQIEGRLRKVLMQAPKNGYFYVLDRETGEFISAKPYVFTNWSSSIDASGRHTINPAATYQDKPALIFPTGAGGHNWPPMAFNPQTRLVYIPARESGMVMTPLPGEYQWKPGQTNAAHQVAFSFFVDLMSPDQRREYDAIIADFPDLPDPATREFLIAYDPVEQQERWRLPLGRAELAGGGVLTTAGNLVVQGTSSGRLVVYRADTGTIVKEIDVGTGIMAAPVSYEIDSEQYIAVLAGFGGAMAPLYPAESAAHRYQNYGRLLAFKLGGTATPLPPVRQPTQTPPPPQLPAVTPEDAQRAAGLFFTYCVLCHGGQGEARLSAYPDLFRMNPQTHEAFQAIVLDGVLAGNGMASFADVLSAQDVAGIQAFLVQGQTALRDQELAASR
ncbi:MAG TPA: PQQ-dependent dehydrogenase, methanol/ethanol family [Steroidobacteraceae bacterium]|nr:PQQ-dependent dehydrogenase, methanol/ethanol family [Steroidobacteraceae bacterium]